VARSFYVCAGCIADRDFARVVQLNADEEEAHLNEKRKAYIDVRQCVYFGGYGPI
jgi:hypothetical protein